MTSTNSDKLELDNDDVFVDDSDNSNDTESEEDVEDEQTIDEETTVKDDDFEDEDEDESVLSGTNLDSMLDKKSSFIDQKIEKDLYNSELALIETDKRERITACLINDNDFGCLMINLVQLYENGKKIILQNEHYPHIQTNEQKAALHILHAGSIIVTKMKKDKWIESEILMERPSDKFNYKKETFKLKELYIDQIIFTLYEILGRSNVKLGKQFVNREIVRLKALNVKRLIEDINCELYCGT